MRFVELFRRKPRILMQAVIDEDLRTRAHVLRRVTGVGTLGPVWRCAIELGLTEMEKQLKKGRKP